MNTEVASDPLALVADQHASPDPSTLATLPKGGANLTYMGHAEVTLALLAVDPRWSWEPVAFDQSSGLPVIDEQGDRLVLWGYLTVHGHRRLCVGTCERRKGDPEKELIGDLLRNGAMRFGIGTKLWSKAVDADPAGSGAGGFTRGGQRGQQRRSAEQPADTPEPAPPGVVALYERVKATAGTDVADVLKTFAAEVSGRKLNIPTLAGDPEFAAAVADILDAHGVAA